MWAGGIFSRRAKAPEGVFPHYEKTFDMCTAGGGARARTLVEVPRVGACLPDFTFQQCFYERLTHERDPTTGL